MGIVGPGGAAAAAAATRVSYVLAVEELARACASHAVIMSVNNSLVLRPGLKHGTPEQKARFLTPFASGQKLGCFALTEPRGGLGRAATRRRSRAREGDDYVLDGRKIFVTNGREAHGRPRLRPDRSPRKGIAASAPSSSRRARPASLVAKTEDKLGHPRLGHRGVRLRGLPRARRRTGWARRARASRSPWRRSTAGASASRPRRWASRRAPTRPRWPMRGAQELRRAHRPAPDGPVDAGRHGDRDRGGPPAHAGARPR